MVGSAEPVASHADLTDDPASLAQNFGSPEYVVHNRPLRSQSDVDDTAKAVAEHLGSSFAEAEGVAVGNTKLVAGTAVSIAQVADTFQGKYTLSRTRHVFDDEGYRTEFEISGMQDRSTLGLMSLGRDQRRRGGRCSAGARGLHRAGDQQRRPPAARQAEAQIPVALGHL